VQVQTKQRQLYEQSGHSRLHGDSARASSSRLSSRPRSSTSIVWNKSEMRSSWWSGATVSPA
jgi:hypothetical protein